MVFIFGILPLIGILLIISIYGIKKINRNISGIQIFIFVLYIFTFFLFLLGMLGHLADYYTPIDPIDFECYTPFNSNHSTTLYFYFILFNVSAFVIWVKGNKIPPIPFVLALCLLYIGFALNFVILIQILDHNTSTLDIYQTRSPAFIFLPFLILTSFISFALILKTIITEKEQHIHKTYKNRILNKVQNLLTHKFSKPIWALILFLPLFILCTIILVLFGQDYDSISKVFTETTTWTFSQKSHPPILDHEGHYLCTVAAKGNPKIVKPLFLGIRNKKPIIVNRQLQIANAFEEQMQDLFPKLHYFIRKNYDKYGYNLSVTINTEKRSNFMYFIMKPLEIVFLIFLYCFAVNPEQKITKQYQLKK